MNSIIAELFNLANGSAASGDKLAAKICADAIIELERLEAIVKKLPKIKRYVNGKFIQDVPIYPEMVAYRNRTDVVERCTIQAWWSREEDGQQLVDVKHQYGSSMECVEHLYDTKEAAQAARSEACPAKE